MIKYTTFTLLLALSLSVNSTLAKGGRLCGDDSVNRGMPATEADAKQDREDSLWISDCYQRLLSATQARSKDFPNLKSVVCEFSVKQDGTIRQIAVVKSSGSEDIDKDALKLIRGIAPFMRCPNSSYAKKSLLVDFANYPVVSVCFKP